MRTDGPVRLSDVGVLNAGAFERLPNLLGRALSARLAASGVRRAGMSDGRVEIALIEIDDGRTARLSTPKGVLTAPDYVVSGSAAGAAQAPHLRTGHREATG